jgi:tRNA (uracil-5-)-methyltransferase TRM9
MDRATQLALNALNQRFYASIADEWSESRKHPWPGFARVLASAPSAGPLRVLDVGAGDGRFAHYLYEREAEAHYLGCDASAALLARARARTLGPHARFLQLDFFRQSLTAALSGQRFELICLLGVLHHVPGQEQRVRLLRELASHLTASGVLALTFWRFDEDERFASRALSFRDYNEHNPEPISVSQLEPGDTLLRWGSAGAPPRYCHFPPPAAREQLIAASTLRISERFHADGRTDRLNEYVLLCP